MREAYRTLVGELRHEPPKTKGSRFLATVAHVPSVSDAEAFVARIGREFANATHNCWAWRVGPEGAEFRFSDDGEPGGSAGRPIFQQIEGHDLTDTVAVVTRWFGGTKLGVGGLVRAYGGAVAQALDLAQVRVVSITRTVTIEHPYECSSAIEALLSAWLLSPTSADYGAAITLVIEVPIARTDVLQHELAERTAGRARITSISG